ncbi:hypothetical protein LTR16_011652, partial [Cryomyces antarcticus]
ICEHHFAIAPSTAPLHDAPISSKLTSTLHIAIAIPPPAPAPPIPPPPLPSATGTTRPHKPSRSHAFAATSLPHSLPPATPPTAAAPDADACTRPRLTSEV